MPPQSAYDSDSSGGGDEPPSAPAPASAATPTPPRGHLWRHSRVRRGTAAASGTSAAANVPVAHEPSGAGGAANARAKSASASASKASSRSVGKASSATAGSASKRSGASTVRRSRPMPHSDESSADDDDEDDEEQVHSTSRMDIVRESDDEEEEDEDDEMDMTMRKQQQQRRRPNMSDEDDDDEDSDDSDVEESVDPRSVLSDDEDDDDEDSDDDDDDMDEDRGGNRRRRQSQTPSTTAGKRPISRTKKRVAPSPSPSASGNGGSSSAPPSRSASASSKGAVSRGGSSRRFSYDPDLEHDDDDEEDDDDDGAFAPSPSPTSSRVKTPRSASSKGKHRGRGSTVTARGRAATTVKGGRAKVPKSKAVSKPPVKGKSSTALSRGKDTGSNTSNATATAPGAVPKRNPARSTRGSHVLTPDDEEDTEFLASDVDNDTDMASAELDPELENIAPSLVGVRVMEKILGRRLKRKTPPPTTHPDPHKLPIDKSGKHLREENIGDASRNFTANSPRNSRHRDSDAMMDVEQPASPSKESVGGDSKTAKDEMSDKQNDASATDSNKDRKGQLVGSTSKPAAGSTSKRGAPKPHISVQDKSVLQRTSGKPPLIPSKPAVGENGDAEFEYLVKWKHLAYIHCEWVDEGVVLRQSQGKSRLRRFHRKQEQSDLQRGSTDPLAPDSEEDELIPEDFVTVDRVLSDRVNANGCKEYFVKWCALPYADASWELAEDVKDDNKIEEYLQRNERPSEELLRPRPRPHPSEYKTLPMPKFKNDGELRDYQMEGFNWLVSCWFNRQGCILADEMGLGKTIQSVSFLNHLFAGESIRGPFLVLAPLSTLGHWQREFQNWTEMNAIVYHGSAESRQVIQQHEWSYGQPQKGPPFKWHVMITTYETILQDATRLKSIEWNAMVVDEAHRLKNRSSKLVDELRNFKSAHRVLLTGTPIQNNSLEVWALLNFLEPEKFMSEKDFADEFGDIKDAETVDRLKALLRPFLLRRLKEDVEKSIPPKEETIISVELTRVQKKWYRAMLEQNFSFLDKGAKSSNVGNLRNIVMELRKCCNHPYLIKGVEELETADLAPGDDGSAHMRHLVQASGKMVLVDKLLPELKKQGHRVLIFSQMIRVLDLLEDYLLDKRWGYERIDGRVRGNDRQQAIDRFSKPDSDKFVFLLCTRAGGQGINLTVADTVIIYDSDWNPQNDVQAQARCHRIGQKTEVKVYRLITRATYEQDMFDRASKKLGLDQAILQNMGKSPLGGQLPGGSKSNKSVSLLNDMNRNDIDSLLKKGAYDVFNEDNTDADAFTSEDIHQILSKRSEVLRTTAANAGPSEFSKASFANKASFAAESDSGKADLALDDPDFWKKLMPEASAAPDPNIEVLPRRRRQTVRYQPNVGSDESDMEEDLSGDEGPPKFGPNGKRLFNKGERHRVQRALLSMGWGRWYDIFDYAGPPVTERRSVDEVAQFCKGLMRCCWDITEKYLSDDPKGKDKIAEIKERVSYIIEDAYAPHRPVIGRVKKKSKKSVLKKQRHKSDSDMDDDDEDDEEEDEENEDELDEDDSVVDSDGEPDQYGNLLGVADSDTANFTDPILMSEDYNSYLTRNGTSILERMELLTDIRSLEIGGSLSRDSEIPVVGASGSQALSEWWDSSFDRDLLRGTYRHGFGNYAQMLVDPDLVFLGRVKPPSQARSRHGSVSAGNGGDNDTGSRSDDNDSDDSGGGSDSDSRKQARATGKRSKMKGIKHSNGKHRDDDDDNSMSENDDESDEEPVMYVSREELDSRNWPPVNVLNVRVRKLVRGFARMRKRAERQAKLDEEIERARQMKEEKRLAREQQKEEQAFERERKAAEANKQWSKKEKADFSKYMSHVGAAPLDNGGRESWVLVKERACLTKKEPMAIEVYAKEYGEMCEQILKADEWCKKHKALMPEYFEAMGLHKDARPDGGGDDPDKSKDDEKADSGKGKKRRGALRYSLQQLEDARVTVITAKKWFERKTLIDLLRNDVLHQLKDPAVEARIEARGVPSARERLPEWWDKNRLSVDIGLLQGIGTHGFDPSQTALDKSLPFRSLLAESVIEFIQATLDQHKEEGRDLDVQHFVIPESAEQVADQDILTFYPKDKMIISRVQRLVDIVLPPNLTNHVPGLAASKSSLAHRQERIMAKGAHRKGQFDDGEDVLGSSKKLTKGTKGKGMQRLNLDGSALLHPVGDGAMSSGLVPLAFEEVPVDRITRRLLRFLKHQKKIHANIIVHLSLPDWVPEETDFVRTYPDGTDSRQRATKRRRSSAANENGRDGNEGGGTRTRDSRVKESFLHRVKKDENGEVIFPVRLGVLTIEALGEIDPSRPAFHTERTIYPIGFRAVRDYASMYDISRVCQYTCEVLDTGEAAPTFQVTCSDAPDSPIQDSSASACWTRVMSAIRDATPEDRRRLHTTVSGPEYFGLSHPLVQELVQDLPGADQLEKYARKTFLPGKVKGGNRDNDDSVRERKITRTSAQGSGRGKGRQKRAAEVDEDSEEAEQRWDEKYRPKRQKRGSMAQDERDGMEEKWDEKGGNDDHEAGCGGREGKVDDDDDDDDLPLM